MFLIIARHSNAVIAQYHGLQGETVAQTIADMQHWVSTNCEYFADVYSNLDLLSPDNRTLDQLRKVVKVKVTYTQAPKEALRRTMQVREDRLRQTERNLYAKRQ